MISRILLLLLLTLSVGLSAQSKPDTIQLDQNISVALPSNYEQTMAFGQTTYRAKLGKAYLQVQVIPQPSTRISNAEELTQLYREFVNSTIQQRQGTLIEQSTIHETELYTHHFKFTSLWNDTLVTQQNMIVLIDPNLYVFTCGYFKQDSSAAKATYDDFMSGITLHTTSFEDQLTTTRTANEKYGELLGLILRYVLLSVVTLTLALWFLKKYDLVQKIKNVLAIAFLAWGGVCLFLFVGNIFYHQYVYSLLIMGSICLIAGFLLRRMRVPVR